MLRTLVSSAILFAGLVYLMKSVVSEPTDRTRVPALQIDSESQEAEQFPSCPQKVLAPAPLSLETALPIADVVARSNARSPQPVRLVNHEVQVAASRGRFPSLKTTSPSNTKNLTVTDRSEDEPTAELAQPKSVVPSAGDSREPRRLSIPSEAADDRSEHPNSTSEERSDASTTKSKAVTADQSSRATPVRAKTRELNLSPAMAARRDRIRQCLAFYYQHRAMNTAEDSPWSIMHAMLSFGVDTEIHIGGANGKRVNATSWLCANGPCRNERLLSLSADGQLVRRTGPGLQGHDGQFLALLAQSRIMDSYPLLVEGERLTIKDLIEAEKASCRPRTELTFKLIGLSHYLEPDATWQASDGSTWSIPRLIEEELAQPINGVTCGGTHRLMAYTYCVQKRLQHGGPVDGQWLRAQQFAVRYQQLALRYQNADGTLSCNFWRGPGDWGGLERKIKTTGHILEWLVFSLPDGQLNDPRIVRAIDALTNMMMQNRYYDFEQGPISHAIRALAVYDERVFDGKPGERSEQLAEYSVPARQPVRSQNMQQGPARPAFGGRRTPSFR